MRRAAGRSILLAGIACLALWGDGTAAAEPARLFGSVEQRFDDLTAFTKWQEVQRRHRAEPASDVAVLDWHRFLAGLAGRSRRAQVEAVHAYMNRRPHVEDAANYGVPEHWATPREFLLRGGDCEDNAIAKYFSLLRLGFADDSLRLVVLNDSPQREAHVVLVVYLDGNALVLDSRREAVLEARAIRHYRPIFALNQQHWWLYRRG